MLQMLELATTTQQPAADVTLSLEPLHDGRPVHGVKFSTLGSTSSSSSLLGSVGFDGSLHLWRVHEDWDEGIELESIVRCSTRPLLQLDFSASGSWAFCAAADGSVYGTDCTSTTPTTVLRGHDSYVNGVCCLETDDMVASSSEDCTVRVWDCRTSSSAAAQTMEMDRECTSVAWSKHQPHLLFAGSLDNQIRCMDRRKASAVVFTLQGHTDTVTGLALHPETGRELVSSAMDGTLRVWDVSPFVAGGKREVATIAHGTPPTNSNGGGDLLRCAYSPCGKYVTAGSGMAGSECVVCVWDASHGQFQPFKAFPGHSAPVIDVCFHPHQSKIASCGLDNRVLVGSFLLL